MGMEIIKDLGYRMVMVGSTEKKRRYCIAKCHCGNEIETKTENLTRSVPSIASCGCSRISEKYGTSQIDGSTKSLIARYNGMIDRCYCATSSKHKTYGARGVKVCDEWLCSNGFKSYVEWCINNENYSEKLQLDKDILSNKLGIYPPIYSPETCMFVSATVNNRATSLISSNNTSGYRGIFKKRNKWSAQICVNRKKINLGTYKTKLEAAKAYDFYVIICNLEHTINRVLEDGEIVENINEYGIRSKVNVF